MGPRLNVLRPSRWAMPAHRAALALTAAGIASGGDTGHGAEPQSLTYRRFTVDVVSNRVVAATPVPDTTLPRWAIDVAQTTFDWTAAAGRGHPLFVAPIPFVVPPCDKGEPFHPHHHQPSLTWLPNGDLLAVWFSTGSEEGLELTVLASRLRAGRATWDPASEFFKATNCNMTGSVVVHDGKGILHHFNGMGRKGARGYERLALFLRESRDNGVTWTPPRAIEPRFTARRRVIQPAFVTRDGVLVQPCDARPVGSGGTCLFMSRDGGKTWVDPGEGKPAPVFADGAVVEGTAAGIHAGIVELLDGRLLALGRGDAIVDPGTGLARTPMSLSGDLGATWTCSPSPFGRIGMGQRPVLMRLREGPIMLVAFTSNRIKEPLRYPTTFIDQQGHAFTGNGMYAALTFDEGRTWPLWKLLTPGTGEYDGGAHHGRFATSPTNAEPAGYLAATQSPDGIIHLVSSRLHYRFNLAWLKQGWATPSVENGLEARPPRTL